MKIYATQLDFPATINLLRITICFDIDKLSSSVEETQRGRLWYQFFINRQLGFNSDFNNAMKMAVLSLRPQPSLSILSPLNHKTSTNNAYTPCLPP